MKQSSRAKRRNQKNNLGLTGPKVFLAEERPLSVRAKEYPNVSVRDIPAFVTRTDSIRRQEAIRAKKVKRSLNAFILYRKAYQEVAMKVAKVTDHQNVSTICAASWNVLEPEEVRDQFKEWATIESERHQLAFPQYKYKPKKSKASESTSSTSPKRAEVSESDYNECQPQYSSRAGATELPNTHQRSGTPLSYSNDSLQQTYNDFGMSTDGLLAAGFSPYTTYPFPQDPSTYGTERYSYSEPPPDAGTSPLFPIHITDNHLSSPTAFNTDTHLINQYIGCIDPALIHLSQTGTVDNTAHRFHCEPADSWNTQGRPGRTWASHVPGAENTASDYVCEPELGVNWQTDDMGLIKESTSF
jgi:hypothetical protein